MARFLYTVQDSQGMVTTGALDADDESHALLPEDAPDFTGTTTEAFREGDRLADDILAG